MDAFWSYLGKRYPKFEISHEEVRQSLINLGLRYPRGPQLKDEGMQVKKKFEPHTIWEGDGKQMNIIINGEIHHYCWYAFVDQFTTLLVGSSITDTESSTSFLEGMKKSKDNVGFYAIGVLLDNRLPETELSSVREFADEHGITIVRTFPGNSKSNGNIENNFSIFEKFVGDVYIQGSTSDDVAKSVATNIAEIFTQQRNHSKRDRLGGRTPTEGCDGTVRPKDRREAVERMKARFEKEEDDFNKKFNLIETLLQVEKLSPESIDKVKENLKKFSPEMIVAARASFEAQASKYPEKYYSIEYFWAILRNKQEEIAKKVYNESFRAGIKLSNELFSKNEISAAEFPAKVNDIVCEIFNMASPSRQLLLLESLCWAIVGFSSKLPLKELWRTVESYIERSIQISVKTWSMVVEFLNKRIGHLIFEDSFFIKRESPPNSLSSIVH